MASCMIPIPIPAIPNPLKMYNPNNKGTLVMGRKIMAAKGVKNINNITMVLKIMRLLPYLLLFELLKYSDTRNFNVLEKSALTDLGNVNLLIIEKNLLNNIYFKTGKKNEK